MTGIIRVTRSKEAWVNRFRRFTIHVNGEAVGKIRRGETLDFPAPSGAYTLRASIDWCGSPTLSGDLEDGQVLSFEVGNGNSAVGLVKGNSYLHLAPVPGRP